MCEHSQDRTHRRYPADVLLVELALKESGIQFELTRFANGEEAVKCLCAPGAEKTAAVQPDVILLDLNTPKSDGFAILGKLRLNSTPRRRADCDYHLVSGEKR
jgi:CheY-like chemotaxis protein